jgi:hypothetical protein
MFLLFSLIKIIPTLTRTCSMFGLASPTLHHEMHNPMPKKPDRCSSRGGLHLFAYQQPQIEAAPSKEIFIISSAI